MYKTNKIKEIYSSNVKIISEKAKANIAEYAHLLLNFETCCNDILYVENADAAVEIVNFVINHNKGDVTTTKNIMTKLFDSYKYHEYSKNSLLKKYNIERNKTTHLKYKIGDKTQIYKINNSNKDINVDAFSKAMAYFSAIHAATMNNNLAMTDELIKYLLQNTTKFLDKLQTTNKLQYEKCTQAITAIITMFLEPKFQIEIIMDLKKYWLHDFNTLSNFSKILVDNNHCNKTIELLTEKPLPNDKSDPDLTNCYSNLALAYYRLGNYTEAKKYYLKAFENCKDDDVICNLISIFTLQNEIDKIDEFIGKLSNGYLKKILLMSFNPSLITDEELKSINPDVLSPYCKEKYEVLKYIAYINKHNRITDLKVKNDFIKFLHNCSDYKNAFTLAIHANEYETARIIFNKIPAEQVNNSKVLKYCNFLFNNYFNLKKILKFIEESKFSDKEAIEVLNTSSTCLLADKKPSEAAETIKKALEYNPHNEETLEIGVATSLLNKDTDTAKEYANKLSQEKQEEIIVSYSLDENQAEDIEQLVEQHDPKKIHEHYQLLKKEAFYKASQNIIKNDVIMWYIDKDIIKSTDTTFIGKYKGLDCYAKISKNLQLDNNIDSYENALKKGILHHSKGGTGVKFIRNNAIELKGSEGDRLFTNILHANDNGKLLIDFDHKGNHNEADRFFRSHHLEYSNDKSLELSGNHPELYSE